MKLKILHFSLLFAATTAKDVYFEDAATDSPGAEKVVPAAKLGVNESANHRRMDQGPGPSGTTVATLIGRGIYAGCAGTYEKQSQALWGRYIWVAVSGPAASRGRFIYFCGGKWRVGSSYRKEAYLRGTYGSTSYGSTNQKCYYFISSATPRPSYLSWPYYAGSSMGPLYVWYLANWRANNGAYGLPGKH